MLPTTHSSCWLEITLPTLSTDIKTHIFELYSSEFQSLDALSSFYKKHDTFPFFANVHQQGTYYALTRTLSDDERITESNTNIARRNHRSVTKRPEILEEKLERDLKFRFSIPWWVLSLRDILGTMVQACGLALQHILEGIKYRDTHNLSFFTTGKEASDNSNCDMETYQEMVYGLCLSRIIHFIVNFRRRFPNKKILISKYDFLDAYTRMAHKASLTIQTILVQGKRVYIYLQLTIRAWENPVICCWFREMVCDLSNKMTLMIGNWDPDIVFSPIQPEVSEPVCMDPLVLLVPARTMAVKVPTKSLGQGDCLLDDIIKVFLGPALNLKLFLLKFIIMSAEIYNISCFYDWFLFQFLVIFALSTSHNLLY